MIADWKATLLLCLTCAALTTIGLVGLVHADDPQRRAMAVLESFPTPKEDWGEDPDIRRMRLRDVAAEVSTLTDARDRAMVIAIGYHESKFARDICEGQKLGDNGKAFGCFQSHDKDRTGGVAGQVQRAARDARRARNYCRANGHHPIKGGFSLYGTGRVCTHPFPARWATYQRIVGEL